MLNWKVHGIDGDAFCCAHQHGDESLGIHALLTAAVFLHEHLYVLFTNFLPYFFVDDPMKLVLADVALLVEPPVVQQFNHIFAVLEYFLQSCLNSPNFEVFSLEG